ncbi:MAG TPA: NAD-dependent epimerase/dehydratase family protein [Aliidongia sp.]|uniref:NAD-dependent epimerase/dehydratase family protein n=1 Tax=Aliidongia sp. TaxID=1914230 RepID=UPI002DDD1269|nr:NAD-dependent epimerase/dehydratase family protein [Aliidongia sp.]HEV2674622.1 NAD-dependent epimerase/dehydratase family protein [Aliidongia sp.]
MTGVAVVTGAYGFVGRHVARSAAANGYRVIGIGHGSWGRDEWQSWGLADWHTAEVTLETLSTYVDTPAVVFHCAGSGSVPFSLAHPVRDYERNVSTTLAVLEFARLHCPAANVVVASSAGVYGAATQMPIRTTDALNPVSPYGMHKRIAEDLCRSYGRNFGIRSVNVRLFSIYGIGIRKQLLWDACMKLSAGDNAFGGTGDETRDWLHVEDAGDLMVRAGDHATSAGAVVNGGTGVAVPIRDIVEAIAADLGCAEPPRFSGRIRAGDPAHYQADISDALSWGWAPRKDLRQEIGRYVEWFRSDVF